MLAQYYNALLRCLIEIMYLLIQYILFPFLILVYYFKKLLISIPGHYK